MLARCLFRVTMMAMGTVIRMSLDDNTLALVVSKQTELRAAIGYCTLPMAVRAFITGGQGSAVPAQPSGGPCEVCKTPVAADEAYSTEGQRLFGKKWGDVRYTKAGEGEPGSDLNRLYLAWIGAKS